MYDEDLDDEHRQPNKRWKEGYVYVIDYGDGKTFKIGHTTQSPEDRLRQICGPSSVIMPMHLVMSCRVNTNCGYVENLMHMQFDNLNIRGEWFSFDFVELVDVYRCLHAFGSFIKLHDRWFDLVPENYQRYIDHGGISMVLPFFTRAEKEEFDNFDFFAAVEILEQHARQAQESQE